MPSITKTQTLTGSQVALTAQSTNGLALINSTSANLSFVVNGGDTATLLSGQMLPLDVSNANKVTVSGTGVVSYIVNAPTA
jgi:hypothetical protein